MKSLLLSLLTLAAPATNGGIEQLRLPPDTRWVLHLDIEGMLGTDLGRELRHAVESTEEIDLSQLQELGLDPFADLLSVTVHGVRGEEDAVAEIRATAHVDNVIERLRSEMEVHEVQAAGTGLLRLGGGGDGEVFLHVTKSAENERRILIGAHPEAMVRALMVRESGAKSWPAEPSTTLRRGPSAGTWLFVATCAPLAELSRFRPSSQVADLVRGGAVEVGEREGNFFATLELEARANADARRLVSILQGGLALLELASADADMPEAVRGLLGTLSAEQLGEGVRLSLRMPAADVVQTLKQIERD